MRALRAAGHRVAVSKPLESGAEQPDGSMRPADAAALAEAAGGMEVDVVCPWPLPRPVTPAAELERLGMTLGLDELVAAVERASQGADLVFVEAAGGLYSPLLPDADTIDLARALDAPVLLVTHETLGCIHDTTAAYRALTAAGVPVVAVALNRQAPPDAPDAEHNAAWIRRLNPGIPLEAVGVGFALDGLLARLSVL